jgi:hypothetical protein
LNLRFVNKKENAKIAENLLSNLPDKDAFPLLKAMKG